MGTARSNVVTKCKVIQYLAKSMVAKRSNFARRQTFHIREDFVEVLKS